MKATYPTTIRVITSDILFQGIYLHIITLYHETNKYILTDKLNYDENPVNFGNIELDSASNVLNSANDPENMKILTNQ